MSNVDFSAFELVSFDIFDTLLHRLVLAPVDVFELVRLRAFEDPRSLLNHQSLDNFVETRMLAEAKARTLRVTEHGGEGEITFDEIYDRWLQETGAARDLADWLKTLELDCEARVLHASVEGKALYDAARDAGCAILFASDMYLSANFLRNTLVNEGFDGAEDYPLYVSGEARLSKHSGSLYGYIAGAEGQKTGMHWLHVGDDPYSDVVKAREAGLATHHATWATINNVPTVRPNAHGCGNFVQSLMKSLKESHACTRLPKDSLMRIGYRVWGPMLFGFSCWLISQFRSADIQHTVFIARDGWLMLKLLQICLEKLPATVMTSSYFYMSRKTGFKTGVRDWHSDRTWYYAAGKNRTTAKRIFSAAGIDADDHRDVLENHGISNIDSVLSEHLKSCAVQALNTVYMEVLRLNANNRKRFSRFYDEAVAGNSRIALVDIGWVGNIQRCFLHSLSDRAASSNVYGYYLGLHSDHMRLNAELGMIMKGWLNCFDKHEEMTQALLSGGVELLEFILTAPHGSTIDLAKKESGIFPILEDQGVQEMEHQALVERAQAGVIRFFEDHVFLLDWLSPETLDNPAWADAFLQLVNEPDHDELQHLANVTHSDGPGANKFRLALAPKLPPENASNLKCWEEAREDAFWKTAFDILNNKPRT